MNNIILLIIASLILPNYHGEIQSSKPLSPREKVVQAQKIVSNYHADSQLINTMIKVVYFFGNDFNPDPNFEDRLTRVLDEVSNYYCEEFLKYGVELKEVPFERSSQKYIFHVVKGDSSSISYNIKSGPAILNEIARKTVGKINPSKDFVLVISSLWNKREDGTYVFHSPYFGGGSSINGVCMVADCDLLDPVLLKDKVQRMKFSEMTVALKECSVSEFNSWYIGGIAHEMAHIFGLQHDFGNKLELTEQTISLMGQFGSRHFKDYLWGGDKAAVFNSASILQLLSHPVFTKSNKNKYLRPNFSISDLMVVHTDSGNIIKTKINTDMTPYAVVALIRPTFRTEYFNQSYTALIDKNDSISINVGQLPKGEENLQLIFLFPNGMTVRLNRVISIDNNSMIRVLSKS